MNKIRVLIADDHPMVRQGLQTFLGVTDEIEVVGEASTGEEAIQKAESLLPDVILMDLIMPGMSGNAAIDELQRRGIPAKILVVTSFVEDNLILQALRSGAIGYLMKDVPPQDLVEAIRGASLGISQLHPEVTKKLMQQAAEKKPVGQMPLDELTDREREVLSLIAAGLSNKDIAAKLYVSIKTVKSHVSSVIQKLGVSTRTQAALVAVKDGLVD